MKMISRRLLLILALALPLAAAIGFALVGHRDVAVAPKLAPAETTQPAVTIALPTELSMVTTSAPAPEPVAIATPAGGLSQDQVAALKKVNSEEGQGELDLEPFLNAIREWADKDPAGCSQWLMDNLTGATRTRCLEEAVAAWAAKSPADALKFLDKHNRDGNLDGVYSAAVAALAGKSPAAALDWLKAHPSLASLDNWQNVLNTWGTKSPLAMAQWFVSQSNPALRDALLPSLLATLRDPAATTALLGSRSPEAGDAALAKAAKANSFADPKFALKLATQIQNADQKAAAIGQVLNQWLDANEAEARAYAAENHLSLPQ